MSELSGDIKGLLTTPSREPERRRRDDHPAGWEPGVAWDGSKGKGTITTGPMEAEPKDWSDLLRSRGMDPDYYEIAEDTIGWRSWDGIKKTETGESVVVQLHYFKAQIRRKREAQDRLSAEQLGSDILSYRPPKKTPPAGTQSFVWCISDTQLGKGDGDGAEGTVGRWIDGIESVKARLKELRKLGRPIGEVVIAGLGDLGEGCSGHYAQQSWRTQLNQAQQDQVVRKLLWRSIKEMAPLADRLTVAAVGGNHGENRQNGKSFTDFADNRDVSVFYPLAEQVAENPALSHVSFVFPQGQELTLTLNFSGTVVALAHGHQFGKDAQKWWSGQAHGMEPVGDATLLLAGHKHHLFVQQSGRKTFIQTPALDGGSDWWRHMSGQTSPPGFLTLVVGENCGPSGWDDLKVV